MLLGRYSVCGHLGPWGWVPMLGLCQCTGGAQGPHGTRDATFDPIWRPEP